MIAQLDPLFLRTAPGRAISRLIGYTLFEGRPATTRGRWWNPFVFANLRFAADRTGGPIDRPVFIVGMGRSGTTILGRILAVHPDVGFLNEPKALWHTIRNDEDIIGSYSAHAGRLHLGPADADDEVKRRARALFNWYLRSSRSDRLIDKYPELVFRHEFVRAIFPDARFLVAVRSPWSTLSSVVRWSDTNAKEQADWWGVRDRKWYTLWSQGVVDDEKNTDLVGLDLADEQDHLIRAAIEWVVTMREAISLLDQDPSSYLCNYEELVCAPRDTIRRVLHACALRGSARTEAYAEAVVNGHAVGGKTRSHSASLPSSLVAAIEDTWARLGTAARANGEVA